MGSNNTPQDAHPRFGFTEKRIVNEALTDLSLVGTMVERTAGLREVVALGVFTLTGGAGSVGFGLEGSNDGVNWFTLSQSGPTELFNTNGQVEILNQSGSGEVDLEHFRYIRVRAQVVAGAPVFSLQVIVTGIARDSEKFTRTESFGPRLGLIPGTQNSAMKPRPAGTLLTNAQINATGVVLGTLASFDVALQGSPDGGTTWVDIGIVSITADGSQLMAVGGETFFSLSQYAHVRVQVRDNGVPNAVTAFTDITLIYTLDNVDWVIDDGGAGGSAFDPSDVFIAVQLAPPGAEVADVIQISLQIYDADGAPLAAVRKLELILYDSSLSGDMDLALNAVFNAVAVGTGVIGLATNRLVLATDASGAATVDVLDVNVENVFITAVNPRGPQLIPQVIVQSNQQQLSFT